MTGDNLAGAVMKYLESKELRQETSKKLMAQTDMMKGKGGSASERAALTILDIVGA